MWSYKDKTFCSSPNCTNECGRKITEQEKAHAISLGLYVAYAYFCGEGTIKEELNDA